MVVNTYLSFNGQCEAAFTFYEQCLGARIGPIFRYGGSPMADTVPAEWQSKVMHASLTFGDQVFMGGDIAAEHYQEPKGFSLSAHPKSAREAERAFHELAK